jgi:hypothetical protein
VAGEVGEPPEVESFRICGTGGVGEAELLVNEDERQEAQRLTWCPGGGRPPGVLPMTVVSGEPRPDPPRGGAIPVPVHIRNAVTSMNTP